ncbi:MAG: HNH endonuclease [Acidimicrobiales bacterium]|nr:HNH endonuclease [Acidimicrobiales bacterium]
MSTSVTVRKYPEFVGKPCPYCGHIMSGEDRRWVPSGDHMTSRARGGDDNPENRTVCCSRCNIVKGTMSADEYREFMLLLGARFDFFAERLMETARYRARDRAAAKKEAGVPQ